MLDDTLHFLANHLDAPDWRRLGEHLPVEWIEEAARRTDATSIRHRRLPAEQVVWLMVALPATLVSGHICRQCGSESV